MKVLGILIMGLLLTPWPVKVSAASFCKDPPEEYVFEPVKARIVDADTGQPIEGAIVIARWGTIHNRYVLKVAEAVTDANGQFNFPGWGPVKRPDGCLWDDDPYMTVFKSGYFSRGLLNTSILERDGPEEERLANAVSSRVRKSRHDGQVIKLRPFVLGAVEERPSAAEPSKVLSYTLTEEHWCLRISFITRAFYFEDPRFPLPNLIGVMREQKSLHPNCLSRLHYLETK